MSGGRKRYRATADTSIQEEDDLPSSKFVKLRNRTRAPVNHGRSSLAVNTSIVSSGKYASRNNVTIGNFKGRGNFGDGKSSGAVNTSFASSGKYASRHNATTGNFKGRGSFGGGDGSSRKYARASFSSMFSGSKTAGSERHVKTKGSPKPIGRPSSSSQSNIDDGTKSSSDPTTPKSQKFNRNQPGSVEKYVKRGPMWKTSYGLQTPEFMKIKEDDSLLQEKREKKRYRNQIMRLRTSKGQPIMRGRIELMLEQIKASSSQTNVKQ